MVSQRNPFFAERVLAQYHRANQVGYDLKTFLFCRYFFAKNRPISHHRETAVILTQYRPMILAILKVFWARSRINLQLTKARNASRQEPIFLGDTPTLAQHSTAFVRRLHPLAQGRLIGLIDDRSGENYWLRSI